MSPPETHPPLPPPELRPGPGFYRQVWQRMRKKPLTMFAYRMVVFLALVALLADFMAYNKPLYCKYKGETYFPLFGDYLSKLGLYRWDADLINADWRTDLELEAAFWPPIRYLPNDLDYNNPRLT
ncbi:MAG: hypothetical protein AAGN35_28145, partial [Bacteroidota bacterium]